MTSTSRPDADDPAGEYQLQCAWGTRERAQRFSDEQVRDRLLPSMVEFVRRMELAFLATADSAGECDSSLRAGPPGFIAVLDERRLALPEYRGNGVHASLGNVTDNPHAGLLMVDFTRDLIGLHVNGRATVVPDATLRADWPQLSEDTAPGRRATHWLLLEVQEAYVHCRKHIPRMAMLPRRRVWGSDDAGRKGGDYFGARETPAAQRTANQTRQPIPAARQ